MSNPIIMGAWLWSPFIRAAEWWHEDRPRLLRRLSVRWPWARWRRPTRRALRDVVIDVVDDGLEAAESKLRIVYNLPDPPDTADDWTGRETVVTNSEAAITRYMRLHAEGAARPAVVEFRRGGETLAVLDVDGLTGFDSPFPKEAREAFKESRKLLRLRRKP